MCPEGTCDVDSCRVGHVSDEMPLGIDDVFEYSPFEPSFVPVDFGRMSKCNRGALTTSLFQVSSPFSPQEYAFIETAKMKIDILDTLSILQFNLDVCLVLSLSRSLGQPRHII